MKKLILFVVLLLPALSWGQGQTTDWNTVKAGTFSTTAIGQALSRAIITGWTNANSFTALSATYTMVSGQAVVASASLRWPDGATGMFTTVTASTACPGAVDAFTATYVPISGTTETITQAAVTRNTDCTVSVQPYPTLSP